MAWVEFDDGLGGVVGVHLIIILLSQKWTGNYSTISIVKYITKLTSGGVVGGVVEYLSIQPQRPYPGKGNR